MIRGAGGGGCAENVESGKEKVDSLPSRLSLRSRRLERVLNLGLCGRLGVVVVDCGLRREQEIR